MRLHGIIETDTALGQFPSCILRQPDGGIVDLLFRVDEYCRAFGQKVSVRYWITPRAVSFEDAQKAAVERMCGIAESSATVVTVEYSEWTAEEIAESTLTVGGHNLLNEMLSGGRVGGHLWIEIEATGESEGR